MIKAGDCLKVKTKTKDDVFGTCVYEVLETGLQAPEQGREKEKDGVLCRMISGSGPAARAGMEVTDSEWKIGIDIQQGVTEVLSRSQADLLIRKQANSSVPGEGVSRPATGCVELS
jgi:hypothetical protein